MPVRVGLQAPRLAVPEWLQGAGCEPVYVGSNPIGQPNLMPTWEHYSLYKARDQFEWWVNAIVTVDGIEFIGGVVWLWPWERRSIGSRWWCLTSGLEFSTRQDWDLWWSNMNTAA